MFYEKPIFFEPNRVFRVYTGGKLIGQFTGVPSEDGFYPEEWVASATRALNKNSAGEHEGISKIQGEELYLDEALQRYGRHILGDRDSFGVLVKYLDSAIRLPMQAHPTKAFSRKHFGSPYGKEECWYILATRENACIYFGFREGVTREDFKAAIRASEVSKTVMEGIAVRYEVKAGDVVFIPANTVHAIGYGCLILEVQEPTDFTIQPERYCGEYRLDDSEMYLGLDEDTALENFDFGKTVYPFVTPRLLREQDGVRYEALIDRQQTESFSLPRVSAQAGASVVLDSCAVYVVAQGEGTLGGKDYCRPVRRGEYFLLPDAARGKFTLRIEGEQATELLICR